MSRRPFAFRARPSVRHLLACGLFPILLAAGIVAALPSMVRAATAAPPPATLNFVDAEIDGVARAMSLVLGRPIAVDPRVKGKLTLYTERAITPAQAYALFTTSLRGLGCALVEDRGLLKVVPEADAKLLSGAAVDAGAVARQGDQVVTQVIRVVHENAANLVPVLRPLISPNNTINLNAGNNSLVITDYASNLQRLGAIVSALDTPGATDVEVIPLRHALASDLAATVQRLGEASGGGGAFAGSAGAAAATSGGAGAGNTAGMGATASAAAGATSVLADARLNALLVRAPNAARLAALRALVARLDQPGASGAGGASLHVVYLRHVEATRLATVLRAALPPAEAVRGTGAAGASAGGSGGGTVVAHPAGASTASGFGGSAASTSGSGSQASATVSEAAAPSTGGYIQADPATNSLLVTAPEPLFREIRAVIDRLDTRRAQLYVESLVVEVDASRALDVGLQWKQLFSISATTELTLGTVATALESMAGTNILSTANLVTLDNEEAKIVVGQNVPFVTGSYTLSSTSSPFQTIERKDVGLTLRIRPQIGRDGAIRMRILQESSSVASTSSTSGPTTNKRSIESSVVVDDGRILVLGGLIEDSEASEANRIPWLAELPYVGGLFRSLSRTRRKTNLVVFLRPRVMRDQAAADDLSVDRYEEIRARQQALPRDVTRVLEAAEPPLLLPAR